MSCQCHRIGGPFIAEDPSCPAHGTEAKVRHRLIDELAEAARTETDIETLRNIALEIASLAMPG